MVDFRGSPDVHTIKRVKIVFIKVFTITDSCTCTEPMQDFRFDSNRTSPPPPPPKKKREMVTINFGDFLLVQYAV